MARDRNKVPQQDKAEGKGLVMGAPLIVIPAKRILALSLKYCEGEDPDLDIGQRINASFSCSAIKMEMRVTGKDEYIENGNTKYAYHMIDSTIVTQEERNRASRKALRKRLQKEILFKEDEVKEEPLVRKLMK